VKSIGNCNSSNTIVQNRNETTQHVELHPNFDIRDNHITYEIGICICFGLSQSFDTISGE